LLDSLEESRKMGLRLVNVYLGHTSRLV
jgi:hypothetical protein